jgi:phosphomannomutase
VVADLAGAFKAYDIRGVVPGQLDEAASHRIGYAFARLLDRRGSDTGSSGAGRTPVLVGHDMRTTSPGLAASFAEGVCDAGRDVLAAGLASTDEVYFGSGSLDAPAAVVTASHNPASYNGFKLCLPGAAALSASTGLDEIREEVLAGTAPVPGRPRGVVGSVTLLASYVEHLHRVAPVSGRRLTVVVDAANGMAGHSVPAVFADLDVDLVPLYFDLDGTFPHHEANPLVPDNLRDLCAAVVHEGADLGLAFDGDADRCFAVDERGRPVSPSAVVCLIAARLLERTAGATVIHNLITSRAVPETIVAHGGVPVRTPVGHSIIKAEMARTGAILGGEHSGHYYFADFWYADSGMLAALHLMAELAATEEPLSALVARYDAYVASGEINLAVADPAGVLRALEASYGGTDGVSIERLDGLSVSAAHWWLNVRPSNTEPLLRLNVEARDDVTMRNVRDSTLTLMRREM